MNDPDGVPEYVVLRRSVSRTDEMDDVVVPFSPETRARMTWLFWLISGLALMWLAVK